MWFNNIALSRSRVVNQTILSIGVDIVLHGLLVLESCIFLLYQTLGGTLVGLGTFFVIVFVYCLVKCFSFSILSFLIEFLHQLVKLFLHLQSLFLQILILYSASLGNLHSLGLFLSQLLECILVIENFFLLRILLGLDNYLAFCYTHIHDIATILRRNNHLVFNNLSFLGNLLCLFCNWLGLLGCWLLLLAVWNKT